MLATAVKERPILFSGPMVQAILAGRKTVTRRVIGLSHLHRSTTPGYDWMWRGQAPVRSIGQQRRHPGGCWQDVRHADFMRLCPFPEGSRLWVRETFRVTGASGYGGVTNAASFEYRAGGGKTFPATWEQYDRASGNTDGWRPSIFLPRWASRITLEVVSVRAEPVQDITEDDAKAEGVGWDPYGNGRVTFSARDLFRELWDKLNAKRGFSWESNPWVWRVEFKPVSPSP